MIRLLLVCGLLLHMGLVFAGEESGFDYDDALATSQGAIGVELSNHHFSDANGRRIDLAELRGKPLVLSMVYTSCYQICPMTTRHLAKIVDKAREALGSDSFNVALVGFDTAMDTPPAMAYFAKQQGVDDDDWFLFSATPATIESLAEELGFLYYKSSNGFDHLIQATVIDADGKVYRQVYGQVFETPLLVDPLIELVLGRAPPEQSVLDNLVARVKLFCTTYDPVRDGYYFDYSIFLGILIGATIIGFTATVVYRGLKH